jgi:23S rRNA G2445 N2-methylase RlmL
VIGVDINETKVSYAKHNSQVYRVSDKIEFICEDFLNFDRLNIRADLVFLNPSWKKPEKGEKFSIFTHIYPDINRAVKISLEISQNIVLLLPKYCDITELATLFYKINREYGRY